MLKEFKEFALKGNMVDMAVGIIMGAAFGTIIKSLVDDIIMPPIGLLMGGVDFSKLAITLKEATADTEAVTMNYGLFINACIAFAIVAFVLFQLIKGMNAAKKKEEATPAPPPQPDVLLEDIRDSL